ncbi:MAG: dihydropteroate synthase [Candidatus Delongbacteria bacterium]|nr:dihydropteroate synthase [Candidatus Delongbacteria bacterium]
MGPRDPGSGQQSGAGTGQSARLVDRVPPGPPGTGAFRHGAERPGPGPCTGAATRLSPGPVRGGPAPGGSASTERSPSVHERRTRAVQKRPRTADSGRKCGTGSHGIWPGGTSLPGRARPAGCGLSPLVEPGTDVLHDRQRFAGRGLPRTRRGSGLPAGSPASAGHELETAGEPGPRDLVLPPAHEAGRQSRRARPQPAPTGGTVPRAAAVRSVSRLVQRLTQPEPLLVGILNLTPDSFSDGGELWGDHGVRPELVLEKARQLLAEGAEVLDLGGESTRPGSLAVSTEEERARVLPALEILQRHDPDCWLSVDTRRARLAAEALDAGAALINDTSAGRDDEALWPLLVARGCATVLMHRLGEPRTMQAAPEYTDVVAQVRDFLAARSARLESLGLAEEKILLDPGIGFGKTTAHNLRLLASLDRLCPGRHLMLAHSRKRYINGLHASGTADRLGGTLATLLSGWRQGVKIFRVHDVAACAQALTVWRAIEHEREVACAGER